MFKSTLSVSVVIALAALSAAIFAPLQTASGREDAKGASNVATAVFAGGCFWCVEADFDKLNGVTETISGYTGGWLENPSYKQVSRESTGHYEAVLVTYDPEVVSFRTLADYHLRHIDPLDDGGQFCDRGHSYKTAIFVLTPEERIEAENAINAAQQELGKPIVTPVLERLEFYSAEEYHQDYYKKNPLRYKYYRTSCGRDRRVKKVWSGKS